MSIRARKQWDVKCPPRKKHMLAGNLVPTVRGAFGSLAAKKKRVYLEIQGVVVDEEARHTAPAHELPASIEDLEPNDYAVLRILKPRKHWGLSRDTADSDDDGDDDDGENGDWVEYRKFDLDDIDLDSIVVAKTSVEMQVGRGNNTEVREFTFGTAKEAQEFCQDLQQLRKLETERANQKMKEFNEQNTEKADKNAIDVLSSTIIDEDINLLVEIVSATDLPVGDLTSSDPYVVVWLGKTEIHRTQCLSKTCDPIWAVDTGSLFIVSSRARDFFSTAGLTFLVKDYDAVGSNETLGKVTIPQQDLLEANGERVEHTLQALLDGFDAKKAVHPPKLNIRVRPATKEDFTFIKTLHAVKKQKRLGVYADAAFVVPAAHAVNRLKRESKSSDAGTLYRVKPSPDPDRDEKLTTWLTEKQIEEEHLKPSTKWIETGSGKLGRLYFEVLRCDGLPNMDSMISGVMGDRTDAFCNIIYEDAIVNTDVINDELDPRWMPWSQRAFLFHVEHPSSQILVGVFDYDFMRSDPIGRVSIDLTNLCSNTEYLLTYDLHASVLDEVRPQQGTLTVRLRFDFPDFRKVVMASLAPPRAIYVNVAKKDDFRSARFVTQGEENLHKLDMDALKSYRNELEGYQDLLFYLKQALVTVLLWRGHHQVHLCGYKFKLALHSMVAFVMGVCLVENADRLPSFLLFSIAWLFIATNEQRQRSPSPWHQSATFGGLWFAFLTGRTWRKDIVPHDKELQPLIHQYLTSLEDRRNEKEEKQENNKKQTSLMDAYFAQEEAEANKQDGEEGVETSTGGFQLSVLKPILLPIQKVLGQVCGTLRIVRSVVMWDESLYAFWIVNVCLFAGLVLLFMPWSWLLRWLLRLVVWTLLGPWMKLVDIFVVKKLQAKGDNFMKRFEHSLEQRSLLLLVRKRAIMIRNEDALQLRTMKRYMFGKFSARVPQFKDYRYPDVPLPESSATPLKAGYSSVHIVERKHGQKLVGSMIPTWGDDGDGAILTAEVKTESGILSRANPINLFKSKKKGT